MTQRRPPAPARGARKRPTTSVPSPRRRRSALWRWRRGLFVVGLVGVAATGGVTSVVFNINLPPEDPLRQTSFVCAADVTTACGPDNAIATFSAEEDRTNVPLEEVPQVVVDAVLATEDRDFFEHGGVDPVGIARALYNDVRGRGVRQGGSTVTQQYVKNVYLTSERSLSRKIKEAVLAVKLERELDKEQILERYLNTIYFGRGAYGVAAASRAYFGKDVRTIGLPEAAYLAGLIRAPEAADALLNPDEASRRRSTALDALLEEGRIDRAQRDAAAAVAWEGHVIPRRDRTKQLNVTPELESIGGAYFVEAVRRQVADKYGDSVVYGGGLRIYVSLDLRMQRAAWNAVTSTLDEPGDPAAALVAVDDRGLVKAMVGGRDYESNKVNLALGTVGGGSGRGAGSSFKPFVLAAALQKGLSLNSRFNAPAEITLPRANAGKDWVVRNYGDASQGVLDLVDATRVSSNTAYAQLMLEVGPERVVDLAKRMGVRSDIRPLNALALGSEGVSPLDMAVGFSTFANRGVHHEADLVVRIEQVDGNGGVRVLEEARPSGRRVLSEEEADQVTHALRQVISSGTGRAAGFGKAAAGKTGTTSDNLDAWFVGYTPKLTAAVWVGYPDMDDDGRVPLMKDVHGIEVTGGSFPAQIWNKFMRNATEGVDHGSFTAARRFPGKVLNPALVLTPDASSTTTGTVEDEDEDEDDDDDGSEPVAPSSTAPGSPSVPTLPSTTSTSSTSTTTTTLPKCNPPPNEFAPPFPNCAQ